MASKKSKFLSTGQKNDVESSARQTNWSLCFLCQTNKPDEKLLCPANAKGENNGYMSVSKKLLAFEEIKSLPLKINLSRLNEGDGIEETLAKNKGVYHKPCYFMFSEHLLQKAQKRVTKEEAGPSPKKTRSVLKSSNTNTDDPKCFFCNQSGGLMHKASTEDIDKKVKKCANNLSDPELLPKLAVGDMPALDAEYHLNCLVGVYNRDRQKSKKSTKSELPISLEAVAFAELVNFIEDPGQDDDIAPVFKLSDMSKLYQERLTQLQADAPKKVNSTRLKERLLLMIPGLRAENHGKEVLLLYNKDIGDAITFACQNSSDVEAMVLAKAAKLVRRNLLSKQKPFDGSFANYNHQEVVPEELLTLVRMILVGPNIKHQNCSRSHEASVLSQLLIFNSVDNTQAVPTATRHKSERETPVPIYLGLKVHSLSRKKCLIDKLHDLGLSISYNRVLQISSDLANSVCRQYEEEGVVCPPKLKKNVFTTAAADNIDHNPSSNTAVGSFHGTAVSLTNHMSNTSSGTDRNVVNITNTPPEHNIPDLPPHFAVVPPATLKSKHPQVPPTEGPVRPLENVCQQALKREHDWLSKVEEGCHKVKLEGDDFIHWSAYHAQHQGEEVNPCATIGLMPLFYENAHSVAMVKHAMVVVKEAIHHLNPDQTPVITMDQPLYSLAKQIQWNYTETLGEQSYVVVLGGLHIEMLYLNILGQWLEGSGWCTALVEAGVTTSGKAASLISGSHVKRSRYAHQVTVASLHILQQSAYKAHIQDIVDPLSFEDWVERSMKEHPQFHYWYKAMELELLLNQYLYSLRTGDFLLYISSLDGLMPWVFALDHVHYARWLPVHIRDMVQLKDTHPEVFEEFMKGNFVVHRSSHRFSSMALDQSHEQTNKEVKGDGGAIGLTESPATLHKWMLAGPEMARLVTEMEASMDEKISSFKNHEEAPGVQKSFVKHVNDMVKVFEDLGNPFLEKSDELLTIDTKDIMDRRVVASVCTAQELGNKQYQMYISERIASDNQPITDIITRNNLLLFRNRTTKTRSRLQVHVDLLKKDCQLFSRLYIACQSREGDLEQFFAHENSPEPPSLSSQGKLRKGTKSDLLPCLELLDNQTPQDVAPKVTVKIFDAAAIVHILKPKTAKTFAEYADREFIPYILAQLQDVQRIDIIWDQYEKDSLKAGERTSRGVGSRRRVSESTAIPKNWSGFLCNADNKVELFSFLSGRIVQSSIEPEKELYSTNRAHVLTCHHSENEERVGIDPCHQEEADTRLILHALHSSRQGHSKILVRTVDTDVVVIAISQFQNLGLSELWIAFGIGKQFRWIAAHTIASNLGPEKANALLFMHAITGCDTVSAFAGRGKKTAWDIWTVFPQVTSTFQCLSGCPESVSPELLLQIERYIVLLYSKTSTATTVNDVRRELFAKGTRSLENIPPTQGALLQHVKRAVYQAGYVWGQTLIAQPELPSPAIWGWEQSEDGWTPKWSDLPQASNICYELIHCGCKTACRGRCKCFREKLKCTGLCACAGHCEQEK